MTPSGDKPTNVLLVSILWYDGGENVETTEMYTKTLELEEHFHKAASSAIYLIPYLVRFNGAYVYEGIELFVISRSFFETP